MATCSTLLPADEQYDYVFEGSSQTLDHILVTPRAAACLILGEL